MPTYTFTYLEIPCDDRAPLVTHKIENGDNEDLFAACSKKLFGNNAATGGLSGNNLESLTLVRPGGRYPRGAMLLIDDNGITKQLPTNSRASQLYNILGPGTSLYGDAFLVATRLEDENFLNSDESHFQEVLRLAENRKKEMEGHLTREEILQAQNTKQIGNDFFGKGDIPSAIRSYTLVITLTNKEYSMYGWMGKQVIQETRTAALSNRALCYIKTSQFSLAERDCRTVISESQSSEEEEEDESRPVGPKVFYRLAQALEGQGDHQGALKALEQCEATKDAPTTEIGALRASLCKQANEWAKANSKKN